VLGDAKKDEGVAVSDEPHKKYPERYRLQATKQAALAVRKSIQMNTDQIASL
jgi:hypothetical protein